MITTSGWGYAHMISCDAYICPVRQELRYPHATEERTEQLHVPEPRAVFLSVNLALGLEAMPASTEEHSQSTGSSPERFCPLGNIWLCLETSWIVTTCNCPGVPLPVLRSTAPVTKIWLNLSKALRWRSLAIDASVLWH